jgi:hypothetical protein
VSQPVRDQRPQHRRPQIESHVDTRVWEHMVTQFCSRKWATGFRLSLPAPEIHPGRVACRDAAEVVR